MGDGAFHNNISMTYFVPLSYQLFPVTQNMKECWPRLHIHGVKLLHLDTKIGNMWHIIYGVNCAAFCGVVIAGIVLIIVITKTLCRKAKDDIPHQTQDNIEQNVPFSSKDDVSYNSSWREKINRVTQTVS